MEPVPLDFQSLTRLALENADEAFQQAVRAQDALGLAIIGVVGDGNVSQTARFDVFIETYGGTAGSSELILSILERADAMPAALVEQTRNLVGKRAREFPLEMPQKERLETLLRDSSKDAEIRRKALWWLWSIDTAMGRRVALEVVRDPEEPPASRVKDRAIANVASIVEDEARKTLEEFALAQLEPPTDPALPVPNPETAVTTLDYLAENDNIHHLFFEEVLTRAAARDMDVRAKVKNLAKWIDLEAAERLVARLQKDGHVSWLTTYLLPPLLDAQPSLVARSIGAGWWPDPCLNAFANHPWETKDDGLYVVVMRGLHALQASDDAKLLIRQRVHARCAATNSEALKEMPRIGVRELLRLALAGVVATGDEDLIGAVGCLDGESFFDEIARASWRDPSRAHRLGEIISRVYTELAPKVLALSLESSGGTALGLAGGLSPNAVKGHAEEMAAVAAENEELLRALCEKSAEVADLILERWGSELSMTAFRALDRSLHIDSRLETIDEAVTAYGRISTQDRAELLHVMGVTSVRLSLLLRILSDRAARPEERPQREDFILALELIGEHLENGTEPGDVLDALRVICEEARDHPVRRAAYNALAKAVPTTEAVELLLARERDESPGMKSAVKDALSAVADRLDHLAADVSHLDRSSAAALLSTVDPSRAAVHARSLLIGAEAASDRRIAARILGECGVAPGDAELLQDQLENEPAADVREEMKRSIRRLRVGDRAAAHETLVELLDLQANSALVEMDPDLLYGVWVPQLVEGLQRVLRSQGNREWGTAIDQLNEIGKILLFRAIDLRGTESGATEKIARAITANVQDYGPVVSSQQIAQQWGWVKHLASMYEMRTEHLAPRGSMDPHPPPDESDWKLALGLFRRGAAPCLQLLKDAVST